jgi:hypothetical protein
MTCCPWQFHGAVRAENPDGTVTLTLTGWNYTSHEQRHHGDTATCRWCRQPIHRAGPVGWEADTPGDCPDAGPLLPDHSPEPLPQVVHATEPCMTRTVPLQFSGNEQVMESGTVADMVHEHVSEDYTVVWQGRGWTVEIRSDYPLWQMTG